MPGVPPIDASLPGFAIENWQGIFAPAGTPEAVVAQIARDKYARLVKASGAKVD